MFARGQLQQLQHQLGLRRRRCFSDDRDDRRGSVDRVNRIGTHERRDHDLEHDRQRNDLDDRDVDFHVHRRHVHGILRRSASRRMDGATRGLRWARRTARLRYWVQRDAGL